MEPKTGSVTGTGPKPVPSDSPWKVA